MQSFPRIVLISMTKPRDGPLQARPGQQHPLKIGLGKQAGHLIVIWGVEKHVETFLTRDPDL